MSTVFLTAKWRNLLMANYAIDPAVLQSYVPGGTELDSFEGIHYISLVGFLFQDVKLRGFAIPFHTTFEEVNLRFYVRYKEDNAWKRGVVFLKEIVPRRAISFVANTLYKENYATHAMKHYWKQDEENMEVAYYWKTGSEWNYIKAVAEKGARFAAPNSGEAFITEHYWGYTFINAKYSGAYQVAHPAWKIHAVKNYDIHCNAALLYGAQFAAALAQAPRSVFLAEGSPIQVYKGVRINVAQ